MSEITYIASGLRLPIVMILANRTLSAPLSIWNDHSDVDVDPGLRMDPVLHGERPGGL